MTDDWKHNVEDLTGGELHQPGPQRIRLVPIIPLYLRVLEKLRRRRTLSFRYGVMDIGFLTGDPALLSLEITSEEALRPLIDRGLLVEGAVLPRHVGITPFGEACLALGIMPAGDVSGFESEKLIQYLRTAMRTMAGAA